MEINKIIKERARMMLAQKSFWDYCRMRVPKIYQDDAEYLQEKCQAFQEFIADDYHVLAVSCPPADRQEFDSEVSGPVVSWQ
jgi:hypothetical protein